MPLPTRAVLTGSMFLFYAPAAFAELSADDVWNDWRSYIESFGYEVTGQDAREGEQLIISGVTIALTPDSDVGGGTILMDRVVMTENSDGTVSVALPSVMPMTFSAIEAQGGVTRISMDYRQTDLDIVVSGASDALLYAYEAKEIKLQSTGFELNNEILPPENGNIEVIFENLSGTSHSLTDDTRRYKQNLNVSAVRYNVVTSDPATQVKSEISGQAQILAFEGQSNIPLAADASGSMNAMLDAGMTADGTFTYSANASSMVVTTPAGT